MASNLRDVSAMDTPISREPRRRLPWIAGGAAVLVALLLLAVPAIRRWWATDQSVDFARLRLGTVTRGELLHDVAAQGRVVAASRPTMFSPATGIVTLRTREGNAVELGELLAVVASPELENRLQQERATLDALRSDGSRLELSIRQQNLANEQKLALAEVELAAAERNVARNEKLAAEGLLNQIEREKAVDALAVARLEIEQAKQSTSIEKEMLEFQLRDARSRADRQLLVVRDVERQVAELEIRAPFAGQVATISVEDSDAVLRGQPIVGVVDLSKLEVEVNIPETYADDVAPGVPAVVRIDSADIDGILTSVAPEVRNAQVQGRIDFRDGTPPGLRQNQRVSARLILDRRENVLKVPRGPFLEAGGGRQVYVVADGLARRRNVTIGAVSVTEVEIVDGLDEGEEIVLSDVGAANGAETIRIDR
ncbi:MAG: efflux RND transporter periplasmic adaptor subunit [Thermoanaerobaculia bacterium]